MVTIYGAEFEPYTYLVWFAAARCAIAVIPFGASIAIKVAGLAREMFHARLWVTIISLPTAVVVSAVFGLEGRGRRQPRAGRAAGHRHVPRVPTGCRQGRQDGAGLRAARSGPATHRRTARHAELRLTPVQLTLL